MKCFFKLTLILFCYIHFSSKSQANDLLYIGQATVDITPALPVAVTGQFNLRIAEKAETPIIVSVLVLETRRNKQIADLAIMVSCDLLYIPTDLIREVRQEVKKRIPDMDISKIILNATHTHTAPVLADEGEYSIPKEGVTQVRDYRSFFVKQVSAGIAAAWNNRAEGSVAWGFSYAVAGYNRRISYSDGTSGMSSKTDLPEFQNLEGSEDHDINTLFFWDKKGKIIATVIGVASPSQEVEGRYAVNADYWHDVREGMKKRFGKEVCVVAWLGAAGDLTPHIRYRQAADDRMRELRKLSRTEEIARRIVLSVEEAYAAVKDDRHSALLLEHKTEMLPLPERLVTQKDYTEANAFVTNAQKQIAADPKAADNLYRMMKWQEATLDRHKKQQTNLKPVYDMELHVIRLGDVAICTNEFELFSDYGIRIQSRSKALQTFVIQLAGSPAWGAYLPTEKAVRGGAYSAVIHSSLIGPQGGQVLVDRTVELINGFYP
ncbi:hypothetical protein [Dyadobacter bucti]|uniref:hypothetical protein n=1 Tax=Dyadobacter bucti TaxID=2572203 RepID=UPI001E3FC0D9|nr:hypothetical protein [Dyadobacter bucti]